MIRLSHLTIQALAGLLVCVGAHGALLTLTNSDFEIPSGLAVGASDSSLNYAVPGWNKVDTSDSQEWAVYRPTPAEGGAESGSNVLAATAYSPATAYIEQDLTNLVQDSTFYTLTAWFLSPDSTNNSATITVFAGTNILGTATSMPATLDRWSQAVITFGSGITSSDDGLPLSIRINEGSTNSGRFFIDDITLDASSELTAPTNLDFEIPGGLAAGTYDSGLDFAVPGWNKNDPSGYPWEWYVYHPLPSEGGAYSGSNVLAGLAYDYTGYVEQQFTNGIENGMIYTVSDWTEDPTSSHFIPNGSVLQLYGGANLLDTTTNIPPSDVVWNEATLSVPSGISSPFAGQPLGVRIMQADWNSYLVFVDDVSISSAPMPITAQTNWDFEYPGDLGVGNSNPDTNDVVPGWVVYAPSGNSDEWIVYSPQSSEGNAQSGANVLEGTAYDPATAFCDQILTNTLQNGAQYTLSFWVNDPDGHTPENSGRLMLYAGSTLLGSVTNTPTAAATWSEASLTYDAGLNNPLSGQHLGVRIMQGATNSGRIFIDNLSLTTSQVLTVPPSFTSVAMVGTSSVALTINGTPTKPYTVLGTPDLSKPLSAWVTVASGTIPSSSFTITNNSGGASQQFYVVEGQ